MLWLDRHFATQRLAEGYFGGTGVPVLLLAGLAMHLAGERVRLPRWRAAPSGFLAHALSLVALIFSKGAVALALAIPTILTGFMLGLGASERRLIREARVSGAPWAIGCLLAGPWLLHLYWQPLATGAGRLAHALLSTSGWQAVTRWCGGHFVIEHGGFAVSLTEACAGIRGVSLFVFLFAAIQLLEVVPMSTKKRGAALFAGVTWMLFLNVLRVAFFVGAGAWIAARTTDSQLSRWRIETLHAHLGWSIYALGLAAFFLAFARSRSQLKPQELA